MSDHADGYTQMRTNGKKIVYGLMLKYSGSHRRGISRSSTEEPSSGGIGIRLKTARIRSRYPRKNRYWSPRGADKPDDSVVVDREYVELHGRTDGCLRK